MGVKLDQKRWEVMKRKLKNSAGETVIEVLASVLIAALSVALLCSAVMASGRLDQKAQETDDIFYEDLNKAQEQTETVTDSNVTIKNEGGTSAGIPVRFYGGAVLSYTKKESGSP